MFQSFLPSLLKVGNDNVHQIEKFSRILIKGAIATPIIAILQGCLLLHNYRVNHIDAPHPISPSRGVVVVSPQDLPLEDNDNHSASAHKQNTDNNIKRNSRTKTTRRNLLQNHHQNQRPLHILVIGDSLTVGVGTSRSSTPVLPESIAKALSKATGGRAVYWTCVGRSGASASQIVRDIYNLNEEVSPIDELKSKLREWYESNMKQHARQWIERRLTNRREGGGQDVENDNGHSPLRKLRRNVDNFFHVMQKRFLYQKIEKISSDESIARSSTSKDREQKLNDVCMEKYDVAVVLTGMNDLKGTLLPFMVQKTKEEIRNHSTTNSVRLKEELNNVLLALKSKMKHSSAKLVLC